MKASFMHLAESLLFLVLQSGGHHTKEDYAVRGKEPKDEVQIYTWKDANLRELTDLVCIYTKKAACFRELCCEHCLKYD